jgi:nucleoside-diphosphate-sugar epimerase
MLGGALCSDPRTAASYRIRTVSRTALPPLGPDHEQRIGDMATLANDPGLLDGVSQIVHCAGTVRNWAGRSRLFSQDVTIMTSLAANARRAGTNRLIYLSSASVYARPRHQRTIREHELPGRPMTDYARTKLACESVLALSGVPYLVLRPRMVIGPGDRHVLPAMIAARRRGYFPRVGDAAQIDVTSIGNMVDALHLALSAPSDVADETMNISNGVPIDAWALADAVFLRLGLPPVAGRFPFSVALAIARGSEAVARLSGASQAPAFTVSGVSSMARDFTLDIGKARAILGYDPRDDLHVSLDAFAGWFRGAEAPAAS